jgi:hypothetical protein
LYARLIALFSALRGLWTLVRLEIDGHVPSAIAPHAAGGHMNSQQLRTVDLAAAQLTISPLTVCAWISAVRSA